MTSSAPTSPRMAIMVFVYGREVKDFRNVDYEAIAMLNVSATQELNRRLEKQTADFVAQAEEISSRSRALRSWNRIAKRRRRALRNWRSRRQKSQC